MKTKFYVVSELRTLTPTLAVFYNENETITPHRCVLMDAKYRVVKGKKNTPNFVGQFNILPEKLYNLFLDAIKFGLFGINCEKK